MKRCVSCARRFPKYVLTNAGGTFYYCRLHRVPGSWPLTDPVRRMTDPVRLKRLRRIRNGDEQSAQVVFHVDERHRDPVVVGEVVRFNGGKWCVDSFQYKSDDPLTACVTAVRA